jgi:hypothetical protein
MAKKVVEKFKCSVCKEKKPFEEMLKCDSCNGTKLEGCDDCDEKGTIECELGFKHPCPSCNGTKKSPCWGCKGGYDGPDPDGLAYPQRCTDCSEKWACPECRGSFGNDEKPIDLNGKRLCRACFKKAAELM